MLAIGELSKRTGVNMSRIAADQLAAVESRIARLSVLRQEQTRMIEGCGNGRVAECRIIEALVGA
jgi:hypothetical protein